MTGYTVTIKESSATLSARERIRIKDTSNARKLDEVVVFGGDKVVINPALFAVLSVHNDKSENKDYEVYVIVDHDGTKYVTGSESFYSAFRDIWDEVKAEDDGDEFSLEVYKVESKNYKGKYVLTCSIM